MNRQSYNAMIDAHREAQEGWNRFTHSDGLREMQLAPAEEIQANLPLYRVMLPFWAYCFVTLCVSTGVCIWAAAT
jgi:hypothetical protein